MVALKDAIAEINKKKLGSPFKELNPIRMLGKYIANNQIREKRKEDINKLIMQVDDLKLDGETRERKAMIRAITNKAKLENTYKKLDKAKK